MKLKEIEQELRLMDLPKWVRNGILKHLQAYGNNCYNQALSDGKELLYSNGRQMEGKILDKLKKP